MRILYLEILLIFMSLLGVSLEEASEEVEVTPRKASKSISYADLKKVSLDSDNPPDTNVYFDHNPPAKTGRSHIDFENEIKAAYSDKQETKVHLNDVIRLVRKGIINEAQATLIWETFTSKNRRPDYTYDIKEDKLGLIGKLMFKSRDFLDSFPAVILCAVLFKVLCSLLLIICFSLYGRRMYIINILVAALFIYNFKILADDMYVVLGSRLISSLIYNTIFLIASYCIHCLFCMLKFHEQFQKWTEIIDVNDHFNGKLIFSSLMVVLGYINSYQSDYFLLQLPFYIYCLIVCIQIGRKSYLHVPSYIQPFDIFLVSVFSVILLIYLQSQMANSFLPDDEILKQVQKALGLENEIVKPDFQFAGYLIASTVLIVICPLYLFIQHQGLGESFTSESFSYKDVFVRLKIIQTEPIFSKNNYMRSLWLTAYGFLALGLLYVGFRARVCYIIVLTIFGLQSFVGISSKEKGVFNVFFFYCTGFITVNAAFLMGKIDDTFAAEVLGSYKGGWIAYTLEVAIKVLLNYYSLEICSANFLTPGPKPNEEEKFSIVEVCGNLVKFAFNYLFAVYLLSLAETEETWLNSLIYSISAIYFFSKVLFYSALTKDVVNRTLIAITIFLAGTRIALLSYNLSTPFYFGTLLTHFSIFATYISFKLEVSAPLCFMMFTGSFIHAVIAQSSFMMIIGLINFCGFLSMTIGNRDNGIKIFLVLLAVNLVIILLNRFSLTIFYDTIGSIVNTCIPDEIMKFLRRLYNRELLSEQLIVKRILGFFYDVFSI